MGGAVRKTMARIWLLVAFAAPAALLAAEETTRVIDLRQVFEQGRMPMKAIAALSFVVIFLTFLYAFTMRPGVLYPKEFLREAEDAAEEGDVEALRAICADNDSAAARIIESATELMAADAAADYMVIRDAIEDEGARQAGVLWQRIQYLQDMAVVAPMLGLLGTVLGMMRSFAGLQGDLNFEDKASVLAAGVGQAMYTTAGGLVVGIVTMAIYAFFRGHVNRLVGGLESACNRVLRRFAGKRRQGRY